ncbi:HAD-IIIA family hydrolase [Allochromatium vinosum]|uniref:HAD-superfamily hydrolase, subfamily IA, variant 1 n=1 Tax=Allochromatium vinosum (strain ATCC 17899 / DSM 180 / NBRC 103801 / NCIMB 10441 / D) TaxID=572477 RepID=D3RQ72_ALLVD|nr:HAD-IIIA family hydrolase [Allochromatium vinosum]ADC61677.1 HAD-superfamily hydrolase, subfamily IA, variant 1 [Allochromatium vinosum DSM 180]
MNFELIVFDWDGTLMDSEARIVTCIQAAFRDLGLPEPVPEVARDVIGLGLDEAMERLLPTGEEELRAKVVVQYRRHFLGGDQSPSELFPGARETLDWMTEQGYRLAVATGKSRAGLNKALDETGLHGVFHATRTADETFSKPHPQMLLELMDELGARAGETLMIGDTEYDLQMANNAGVRSLAVCYGVHEPGRLLACEPLACLDSLWAIRDWLSARQAN